MTWSCWSGSRRWPCWPYEAALARLDAPDEAALRRALATFTALGAPAAARLARQRLRALGVRAIPVGPRSATWDDPFGLIRREREILAEICAGQTNAAIAAKLFISATTVDHHVSAVLAKLGAPNRNAAAAQAARRNLFNERGSCHLAPAAGAAPVRHDMKLGFQCVLTR